MFLQIGNERLSLLIVDERPAAGFTLVYAQAKAFRLLSPDCGRNGRILRYHDV